MPCILGIDPGLASTGWGVVEADGGRLRYRDAGVVTTPAGDADGDRLLHVATLVEAVIDRYRPILAGVEALYFTRNVTSAIPVAQARGVVLMTLARAGVPSVAFTPQQVKQSVVGAGGAAKNQVIEMIRLILGMADPPTSDHAADALAAAVAAWHHHDAAPFGAWEVHRG